MKKFLAKFILFGTPVWSVLAFYLYKDPFKVLYHYDKYYHPERYHHGVLALNQDYVSTETWLNNYDKYHYDSYIFGNSRSQYFEISAWNKHIQAKKSYHFNAWKEGLYGVERKLEFLTRRNAPIKNALFVFDHDLLEQDSNRNDFDRKHPILSGESYISFQLYNLRRYLNINFLKPYIDNQLTGRYVPYMESVIIKGMPGIYDETINENRSVALEKSIDEDPEKYYNKKDNPFYQRSDSVRYSKPIFNENHIRLLHSIKRMLVKNQTDYRIIINPMYDQLKLDSTDLKILYDVFGKKYVFDFSGINEITSNKYNYYEAAHFRPKVATYLMNKVYSDSSTY